MNFISYPDREFLMLELAGRITSQLSEELRIYGKASLSVPGGTTPGPIFDILSGVQLDWANVAVLLNDERWVGEDNPRSNTRLLKERLLVDKAAAATLIPLYAEASAPELMLGQLAQGIEPHLPLTVLLLGMGVNSLSAGPASVPRVKWAIRSFTLTEAQELARQALAAETVREVHHLINAALRRAGLGEIVHEPE